MYNLFSKLCVLYTNDEKNNSDFWGMSIISKVVFYAWIRSLRYVSRDMCRHPLSLWSCLSVSLWVSDDPPCLEALGPEGGWTRRHAMEKPVQFSSWTLLPLQYAPHYIIKWLIENVGIKYMLIIYSNYMLVGGLVIVGLWKHFMHKRLEAILTKSYVTIWALSIQKRTSAIKNRVSLTAIQYTSLCHTEERIFP